MRPGSGSRNTLEVRLSCGVVVSCKPEVYDAIGSLVRRLSATCVLSVNLSVPWV